MRPATVTLLFLLTLGSCARDDRVDDRARRDFVCDAITSLGELGTAAVRYRDQQGRWPASAGDLQGLLSWSPEQVERFDRVAVLRPAASGLAVINRTSGETVFLIANESTPAQIVLGGGAGR